MKRLALALVIAAFAAPAAAQHVQPVPWAVQQPSARDFRDTYTAGALAADVTGRVELMCTVTDEYKLDCAIHTETPPDYGFGPAALRLSRLYVVSPEHPGMRIGGRVLLPIRYAID